MQRLVQCARLMLRERLQIFGAIAQALRVAGRARPRRAAAFSRQTARIANRRLVSYDARAIKRAAVIIFPQPREQAGKPQLQHIVPVRHRVPIVAVCRAHTQRVHMLCLFRHIAQRPFVRFLFPFAPLLLQDEIVPDVILKQFRRLHGQLRMIQHAGKRPRFFHRLILFARHGRIRHGPQLIRREAALLPPAHGAILFLDRFAVIKKLSPEHCHFTPSRILPARRNFAAARPRGLLPLL